MIPTIRLARLGDVCEMLALESRYYVGNLDESRRADGFVSALHSRDWFERTVAGGGLHVAEIDGAVAGFIAVTDPPARTTPGLPPIVTAMLDLAATIEFDGAPIGAQRYALRGPVLIDRQARGRGIYTAFNVATAAAYRDRFDIGVLFVSTGNPRSLHTTTTKLGAEPLAVFEADGGTYHFLAFSFRQGAACCGS